MRNISFLTEQDQCHCSCCGLRHVVGKLVVFMGYFANLAHQLLAILYQEN